LIDADGYIKVTDFGLSKKARLNEVQSFPAEGIPEYLPPEILMKQKGTHTVDYWALGLMLYEMTTGLVPFFS
jgi:serine/threonine protein kinase